jgi:predicted acylesterase/phospholipase RssA
MIPYYPTRMSVVFQKLALGGGGMKGILQIGALQRLATYQPLEFPNGVYGCSIGSIIATYVAFGLPIENIKSIAQKYLNMDNVVPKSSFSDMLKAFSTKGMYSMDLFEQTAISMFSDAGIDIRDKRICDAKMPLYIVSSNITKGIPTVFSGNTPVLSALKCSCCIPGVFRPQELYGSLYVDGDLFTPCIASLVDITPDTLILSLTKQRGDLITTTTVDKLSPVDYVYQLYLMMMIRFYKAQQVKHMVSLYYPGLRSNSNIKELDIDKILDSAGSQLDRFLTKRVDERLPEIIDGGSTNEFVH